MPSAHCQNTKLRPITKLGSFSKILAAVSVMFLPGMCVALFVMPLLDFGNNSIAVSNEAWIYWVLTIPLTAITVLIWSFRHEPELWDQAQQSYGQPPETWWRCHVCQELWPSPAYFSCGECYHMRCSSCKDFQPLMDLDVQRSTGRFKLLGYVLGLTAATTLVVTMSWWYTHNPYARPSNGLGRPHESAIQCANDDRWQGDHAFAIAISQTWELPDVTRLLPPLTLMILAIMLGAIRRAHQNGHLQQAQYHLQETRQAPIMTQEVDAWQSNLNFLERNDSWLTSVTKSLKRTRDGLTASLVFQILLAATAWLFTVIAAFADFSGAETALWLFPSSTWLWTIPVIAGCVAVGTTWLRKSSGTPSADPTSKREKVSSRPTFLKVAFNSAQQGRSFLLLTTFTIVLLSVSVMTAISMNAIELHSGRLSLEMKLVVMALVFVVGILLVLGLYVVWETPDGPREWITPLSSAHVSTIEKTNSGDSRGKIQRVKMFVEDHLNVNILWWPLSQLPPQRQPEQTRIVWRCKCGASMSCCMTASRADRFLQEVARHKAAPSGSPILPTHHLSQSSASEQQLSRAGVSVRPRVVPPPRSGNVTPPVPLTSGIGANDSTIAVSDKYLHWCVKAQTTTTRVAELEMKYLNEKTLVPRLLATYGAMVGGRSWLTLTSCFGARFVKFRKLSLTADLVTYLRDEIPPRPHPEYEYEYVDVNSTEEDFVKWLQAVFEVRMAYPKCPETLALCNLLDHIPRKINGKMRQFDGYGMYAVSAYCLWKSMVALLIASIAPAVFMIRWLVGHKGDWQNALSLLGVTYSLLNILVLQHDRWSFDTARLQV